MLHHIRSCVTVLFFNYRPFHLLSLSCHITLLKLSCIFPSFSPISIPLICFQVRAHIMNKLRALLTPTLFFFCFCVCVCMCVFSFSFFSVSNCNLASARMWDESKCGAVTYAEHPKRDMTKFKVENTKRYAVFGDFCPNSIFF